MNQNTRNSDERDLIMLAMKLQESKVIIGSVCMVLNNYLQDVSKYGGKQEMNSFAACMKEVQQASSNTLSCIDDLLLKLNEESSLIEPLRILMQLSYGDGHLPESLFHAPQQIRNISQMGVMYRKLLD